MISSAEVEDKSIFTHLSTLLNTGHSGGQVVAVTGCVHSNGPTATINISSDSSSKATTASEEEHFFEVESCNPSKLTLESVMKPELPPKSGVNVTDHIPDLFAALLHATESMSLTSSSPPQYAVTVYQFVNWLVHRCHVKIPYRFQTATKEWRCKPWDIMEKWSPSDEDLEKTKYSRIKPPSAYMQYIRRYAQDLTVGQDNVSLLFDRSTLVCWVRFLAELLARANELSSLWWTLGEKGLRRLCDTLGMINFLLDTKELKFAITKTSLRETFMPKYGFNMQPLVYALVDVRS
ncbi:hypothetical protein C8Q74DRAFT_756916 [Fomes fomentarius]|nr:hypothetical protein C8Q74DRAFT_756916 [Fomes fomentarius]